MRCCRRPGSGSSCSRSCGWCATRLAAFCRRHQLKRRGLLLLSLAAVLSLLLPDAPLSHHFLSEDSARQRLLSENEQRLQRSQRFLERYRASVGGQPGLQPQPQPQPQPRSYPATRNDSPAAEVGVTVLTMARGRRMAKGVVAYRTQYLTQSVAGLLQLLNDTSLRRSYSLHICNVDDRPELFAEAQLLEDLLPSFKRYGAGTPRNSSSAAPPAVPPRVVWEKLKADYVYCLQQTLARGVRFALLVEDDAVAHSQLFRVLEHVLERVVEAPDARPVAYLKLYHPQRLLGYISLEAERLTELAALSLTLGAVLTLLTRSARHHQDGDDDDARRSLLVAWAGWVVVIAVLALAAGRTNLLELRRLSPQLYQVTPTPSCCIPAVLWTRSGALGVSRYLLNVTCTASRSTDIRMDEFREVSGARGLLVQPNLFSHIGLLSSLRTKEVSPLIVQ